MDHQITTGYLILPLPTQREGIFQATLHCLLMHQGLSDYVTLDIYKLLQETIN